jgi:hypothetical protein
MGPALWGVMLLSLAPTWVGAATVNFPDTTQVQVWKGPNSITPSTWKDVIGYGFLFETHGATYDPVSQKLTIETNWKGPGLNFFGIQAADLFLDVDVDGTWDLAVGLSKNRLNQVYSLSSASDYYTSEDKLARARIIYGGRYSDSPPSNPQPVPVEAKGSLDTTIHGLVSWSHSGHWFVTINLGWLSNYFDPSSGFAFLWGTATCANDTIVGVYAPVGVVPLPPSALLLGSGLLLLRLWAVRRKGHF